jgi:two-component system, NarL family, response regulator NreC
VVLAEDHDMMRHSLRRLLESEADIDLIAEASDLATVMAAVRRGRPDVLAFDLSMPTGSSIEAIRRLREHAPGTEIVVLTMRASPTLALQTLNAGAIGFVLKEMADADLPAAVRCATRRERYLSPRMPADLGR